MMRSDFKVGQEVYFGREHGQKTLGEIEKLNPKKAKIRTLEARGMRNKVGTIWLVPYEMITPVTGNPEPKPVPATQPLVYNPFDENMDILSAIAGVYNELSPENLSCDGELNHAQVQRRYSECQRKLKGLFIALGREVDEGEMMDWQLARMDHQRKNKVG